MLRKLRIVYFAHSLRSDWNNGNAHFLRGLMRALGQLGHEVLISESEHSWSIENLKKESAGEQSLSQFNAVYPDLNIATRSVNCMTPEECLRAQLRGCDVVILHEWNPPELAQTLLALRQQLGFRLLFHDTHHRASSSPDQMKRFGLARFDGVLAFGRELCDIYHHNYGITRSWVLHEAADTSVFKPSPESSRSNELVWIGNWGDGERALEIREFLLKPAEVLRGLVRTNIFGVRYPVEALDELRISGATYSGYLPNLCAPAVYASARATIHIPRQQYSQAMKGIPTIRVFEALACGIPLVSAPWEDAECLFREGDFRKVRNESEMISALRDLVTDSIAAQDQAERGLETILSRHTCAHRARELADICEEVLL
jgi:spore maturation protein CgeB